ncbi:MAG: hypothetical protein IBJ17_11850 [Reyranella sp.]|jgi:hypothetical protein|nr:hypothetical protein [Reyranella sp.]
MTLSRRFLMALPATAMACEAAAQSAAWMPVEGDKAFFVEMPGAPVYKVLDAVSAGGTRFVYHSYSLEYRRLSFVAQTALYPADVEVRNARASLQSVLDDRAQRLAGGKWRQVDWKTVQGAPGVEATGPLPGGNALRQFAVLKGWRFVSLGYLAPADAMSAPEAQRFFSSLRLLG